MNADEIVRALRICNQPKGHRCSECPVFSRYDHRRCKSVVDRAAVDLIESLQSQLGDKAALLDAAISGQETLQRALSESQRRVQDARNELCQRCGRYLEAHNGACNGCRWKEGYQA